MCMHCAYTPCICVLTKLELKLDILKSSKSNQELVQEGKNSKLMGVSAGDMAQKITSALSNISPPKSNQELENADNVTEQADQVAPAP